MLIYKYFSSIFTYLVSKTSLRFTFLISFFAVLVFFSVHFIAYADYDTPSWWTFSDNSHQHCDSGNYGNSYSLYTTWSGIEACGPGTTITETFPVGASQYEWQCTELVARYLYLAFGVPSIVADGDQIVSNYASAYPSVFRAIDNTDGSNATNHIWPKVGDVLSYSDVHTAIVAGVTITDAINGDATLTLTEQNASTTGTITQEFVGWKIKGGIDDPSDTGSDTVTGWLTPRIWNVVSSPNPASYNVLNAVTSTSSSDVWAVGIYASTNAHPLAVHWDGSSWSSNGISSSYLGGLNGVSHISSSNILAVGASGAATLAMHYDGSNWTTVPSDNPGDYPYLAAVGSDRGGDGWAVGNTTDSFDNAHPLIEQYMGSSTGFQNWLPYGSTIFPDLSGTTNNILNAVTVYSSTDAWVVGYYRDNNNHKQPLVYHWDGSSWTNISAPSPSGSPETVLNGVAELSSNNIWAVGYTYNSGATARLTYTIHCIGIPTCSWNIVSSPNPSQSNDDYLTAIDTLGDYEIYAVGATRGPTTAQHYHPLILRFDGGQWNQESAPDAGSSVDNILYGITVTSSGTNEGESWAVGPYGSTNTLTEMLQ